MAMDDIEGVRRLVFLYGQLLDDSRHHEWADLFTDDAVYFGINACANGADSVVAMEV